MDVSSCRYKIYVQQHVRIQKNNGIALDFPFSSVDPLRIAPNYTNYSTLYSRVERGTRIKQ